MKFFDKRNNKVCEAYSIREDGNKIFVKFTPNGKEYSYFASNIELITENNKIFSSINAPFILYRTQCTCWRCKGKTDIYTYIIFDDGTEDSLIYPWDVERALDNQYLAYHMQDPSCEYYGVLVVGDYPKFDDILLKKYPDIFSLQYSKTINKAYCANSCIHCGALQGKNYVYRLINKVIETKSPLEIFDK